MSKVLERILLDRFQGVLGSRDQQFGFKRGHSCSDCSFVLKGSVDYYLSNGNQAMYSAALDLSKAYDRVSYYRLFQKMLDRGCPTYFVRLLYTWYGNQNFRIRWRNSLLEPFGSRNGLRQGSVLSPSLFNVYLDDLVVRLEKSGEGARLHGLFVGCLVYADDITLLSPTVSGLQNMLDICYSFTN